MIVEPVETVPVEVSARAGKALTGRDGLSAGQAVMKAEARVYTSFGVRGTSCGDGKGNCLSEARM